MRKVFENGYRKFAIYVSERLPTDFGKDDAENLADFLWSALQECPENRRSTTELLDHIFLVG